jgi:hypothetical protein
MAQNMIEKKRLLEEFMAAHKNDTVPEFIAAAMNFYSRNGCTRQELEDNLWLLDEPAQDAAHDPCFKVSYSEAEWPIGGIVIGYVPAAWGMSG